MIKKEQGITLIILVVTIIIMLILAGVVIYYSNVVDKSKFQLIFTNMKLIQIKVNMISERTSFDEDKTRYIGEKLKDASNKNEIAGNVLTAEELEDENYYIYNQETLDSIGLEGIKLAEDEVYIVNYHTLDVIYPKGCVGLDGEVKRKLSEMLP